MPGSEDILEVQGISYAYGSKNAITDITFSAKLGEVVGILGQNGCGKTTTLKCINGSIRPQSGQVLFDGKAIAGMSKRQIAKRMAFVTQTSHPGFGFTVFDTVMMGRYAHQGFNADETKEDVEIVRQALADVGLAGFEDRNINEMSGGEKRRAFIARALAQEPDVLLLDEPTLHLDVNHQFDLLELVCDLAREKNILVVIVTHDIILSARYCDRIILMEEGRITEQGPSISVSTEENYRKTFEIESEIGYDDRFGPDVTLIGRSG